MSGEGAPPGGEPQLEDRSPLEAGVGERPCQEGSGDGPLAGGREVGDCTQGEVVIVRPSVKEVEGKGG